MTDQSLQAQIAEKLAAARRWYHTASVSCDTVAQADVELNAVLKLLALLEPPHQERREEKEESRVLPSAKPVPDAHVERSASDAPQWAVRFHEAYERLAPQFGYETRRETRRFDPDSPNGRLMFAVCAEVMSTLPAPPVTGEGERIDCDLSQSWDGHVDQVRDAIKAIDRQHAESAAAAPGIAVGGSAVTGEGAEEKNEAEIEQRTGGECD